MRHFEYLNMFYYTLKSLCIINSVRKTWSGTGYFVYIKLLIRITLIRLLVNKTKVKYKGQKYYNIG